MLTSIAGNPQAGHLDFAAQVISCLPARVAEAVRSRLAHARYLLSAAEPEEDMRKAQLEKLIEESDPAVIRSTESLAPVIDTVNRNIVCLLPPCHTCLETSLAGSV